MRTLLLAAAAFLLGAAAGFLYTEDGKPEASGDGPSMRLVIVSDDLLLTPSDFEELSVSEDGSVFQMKLDAEASDKVLSFTSKHLGNRMTLVFGGYMDSDPPIIREAISAEAGGGVTKSKNAARELLRLASAVHALEP